LDAREKGAAQVTQGEELKLRSVEKRYGDAVALEALDLHIAPGEILALTGPSGAGKTTICRLISGIEAPDAGEIWLGRRRLDGLSPQARHVSDMFETYALYPQLSVRDNSAFPLRAPGHEMRNDEHTIAARVGEVLELVEMADLAQRMPAELSGGQKQRVALCRALVQDPTAYLLDEPIAHLDAKLRHKLRGAIRRRLRLTGVPTLWCSPDGLEALSVADRVAVLVNGRVEQVDTPMRVFLAPASVRVARLLGDPPTNLLEGELGRQSDQPVFRGNGFSIGLPEPLARRLETVAGSHQVVLGIPPTELTVAPASSAADGAAAEIYTFEPFGKYTVTTVRLGGSLIKSKSFTQTPLRPGDPVRVRFQSSSFLLFDLETGKALQ
jgi:ABC-type sugar transport system ATPase subunit